jgi:hypothetical protein
MPDVLPQDDIEVRHMPLLQNQSAAQTRRTAADNWVEAEKILTESIYHDDRRQPCKCTSSSNSSSQCAAASLLKDSFRYLLADQERYSHFDCYERYTLDAVSKFAWVSGVHMVLDEDVKTILPRFDEEVCFKCEHQFFPTLLTALAS